MSKRFGYIGCLLLILSALGCNPEAKWETKDVEIFITVNTQSACFVECTFETNKDAYFLISITEARDDYNPMDPNNQKQFMTLAIDSANVDYLAWRNALLKDGEFNIAPFASHALQYGTTDHFFTGLKQNTDYWIYAFVVDPKTLAPCGRLFLTPIHTAPSSTVKVKFDYRVKGFWDYCYPLDSTGRINTHYPYAGLTHDSAELVESGISPQEVFENWLELKREFPYQEHAFFGVTAVENDGLDGHAAFMYGHTYYTAITGLDGDISSSVVYKFVWTGDDCEYYFTDTDSTNILKKGVW